MSFFYFTENKHHRKRTVNELLQVRDKNFINSFFYNLTKQTSMQTIYKNNFATKFVTALMLSIVLAVASFSGAKAQSIANYAFTTSTSGSLDDLSTGATSLLTGNNDGVATAITPIGFNFTFMGTTYSHFCANSDGQLRLYTSSTGTAIGTNGAAPAAGVVTLAPMSGDNEVNDGVRFKTTGTAPNRKFVCEWVQFYVNWTPNLTNAGNMQLWLDEATGRIDFVYGEIYNASSSSQTRSIFISSSNATNTVGSVTIGATPTFTNSTTLVSNTIAAGSGVATGSPLIANLSSSAQGSRRVYTFTPPSTVPTTPTNLTFASITGTGMTLNWTDSPDESLYAIYRSTDGVTYTQVGTTAQNVVTYPAATGLTPGITYYWRVVAMNEAKSSGNLDGTQATTAAATYYYVGSATAIDLSVNTANLWNTAADGSGSQRTTAANSDILIIDGTNTGATNNSGTTITSSATAAVSLGSLRVTNNTTLVLKSSSATSRAITLTGSVGDELSVASGSTLTINDAANPVTIVFTTGTGMTGTIAGTLNLGGSTTNAVTTTGGTGTLVTVTGTVNLAVAGTTTQFVGSATTLAFASGANCNVTGGTTTGLPGIPLATWDAASNLTINSTALTTGTTVSTNGGTQSFGNFTYNCPNATGTMAWFTTNAVTIKGNLTLTSSGASGKLALVSSGTLTVNGNIVVSAGTLIAASSSTGTVIALGNTSINGGTLDINTGTFSQRGTTFTNNATLTGTATTATLQFYSPTNTAQTYTGTGTVTTNVGTISVQNGGGLSITTTNQTPTLRVNLFIGTVTGSNKITIGTGAALPTTVQIGATGLTTTGGSFDANPTMNLGTGTYTILYQYETAARTTGYEIPTTRTVSAVTIGNSNNVTLAGGNVSIGTLTLQAGNFTTNSSNIATITGTTTTSTARTTYSSTAASSSGTTITITSTTGLYVGMNVSVTAGTGAFAANTVVTSIPSSTTFVVSAAPTTALSGATVAGIGGWVKGPLVLTLPASLATGSTYNFPVGKSGYNNFELVNPTTNAGGTVTVSAEAFDGNCGGTAGTLMGSINTSRYWAASITGGSANFTNTFVRLNDTRGTQDAIAASSTLTGAYAQQGGVVATTTSTSILTTTPAQTAIPGYYVMGNLAAASFGTVTITPTGNQCTNIARPISAVVIPGGAAISTVTLSYQVNGGTAVNVAMTNSTNNGGLNADTWTGTIPTVTPTNATVTWSITAVDGNSLSKTYTGTSYTDEPLNGVTASIIASASTICNGASVNLTASLAKAGTQVIGTSTNVYSSTSTSNDPTAFNNRYTGYRLQMIYTAAELNAAGLYAGNITSMAFNVNSLGSAATNANFRVKIAHTSLTALTAFVDSTTGFTDVYLPKTYTHTASGWQTITFDNSFNWNGTSNIVVQLYMDGADLTYSAATYYTATSGNTVAYSVYNTTSSAVSPTLSTNRLNTTFAGNSAPVPSSYSWSDGTNTIGSTNPIVVTPSIGSTTYTASIVASGCTFSPSPTKAITVNPLPAVTDNSNYSQCGNAIFTASSAATNPTYKFYDAATGGTLLATVTTATGTDATYTKTSSLTYDAENYVWVTVTDGSTGCTNASRVMLTVNVVTPQVVTTTAGASICAGTVKQLDITSTTTNYANYAWSPITNLYTDATHTTHITAGANYTTVYYWSSSTVASETITITATNPNPGDCNTNASLSMTVVANPTVANVTATPATVCSGSNVALNASTVNAGNVTVGLGATTGSSYDAIFYHLYGGNQTQFMIKASELTAANIYAGALTALGINMNTVTSVNYQGFAISIAQTTNTSMSTMLSSGFTQVYTGTGTGGGYTPTTGVNTFTFGNGGAASSFTWDGTSNLVIKICWSNNNTGGTSNFAKIDAQSFVSCAYYRADSQTPATICGGSTATGTTSNRPQFTLYGQVLGGAGTLNWSWNSTSASGITSTYPSANAGNAVPTNTGASGTITYSVTGALAAAPNCATTVAASVVTVNPLPAAPTNASNTTSCGTPQFVITTGVSSPTVKFYAVGGTTPLQSGSGLSYDLTTYVNGDNTLEVTVTDGNGCESPRTSITINATAPPTLTTNPAHGSTVNSCVNKVETIALTSAASNFDTYTWTSSLGNTSNLHPNSNGTGTLAGGETTVFYKRSSTTASEVITLTAVKANCTASSAITFAVNANPVVSSVTATPATVCSGSAVTLSTVAYMPTSGASAPTYTAPPAVSNPTTDEDLGNITITDASANTILNNTSARNSLVGTIGTATGTAGSYSNFTAFGPYMLISGATYNLSLSSLQNTTAYSNGFGLFIDYNADGDFADAGEFVYVSPALVSGAHTRTATFTVPTGLTSGLRRMRVISKESSLVATPTDAVSYGEYEEYMINIQSATGLVFSWSDGIGGTIANGNPSTANPVNSGASAINVTYTATATDAASGCYTTGSATAVVVNPLPAAPTQSSATTQCGLPTFSVNVVAGATYKWYTASTGGTAISGATSSSYSPTSGYVADGSTVNHFYVSVTNAQGCESPRADITAIVNTPPAIAIQASSNTVCAKGIATLELTPATAGSFSTVTWSPVTNLYTDAAATTAYTGGNAAIVYYKRLSATAAEIITATGISTSTTPSCTTTTTTTMVVNDTPNIVSVTATPSPICSGSNATLAASSQGIGAGTVTVGTQTTSDYTGGPYIQGGCAANKAQYLYTAAELTAAGLNAGNFTALSFNVTSNGSGAIPNLSIAMANTSVTALTTTFETAVGSTVYTAATYTTVAGTNTHTFTTPFNWDGTSNVLITICHDYLCDGSSSVSLGSVTNKAIYANAGTSGSICSSQTTGTLGTNRPIITFDGQIGTANNTGSYNWVWSNGTTTVGTAATISDVPVNNGTTATTVTYCATATNASTGCSTQKCATTVTVNPVPTAPVSTSPASVCGTPTYTVVGSTYTSPTYNWYTAPTGGTPVATTSVPSYTYLGYAVGTNTLYASVSSNGCEGARTQIDIIATSAPALTLSQTGSVNTCVNRIETITASGTGYTNFTWSPTTNLYTDASATTAYTGGNAATVYFKNNTANSVTLTCTADGGGCINTAQVTFVTNANPTVQNVTATPTPVCANSVVDLSAKMLTVSDVPVGAGATTTTSDGTYISPYDNWWYGLRVQYVVRKSELLAAGLTAGPINSLGFDLTSAVSTNVGFTIKMAHSTSAADATVATSTFATPTFTTVYSEDYTPYVGVNTHVFSTPFVWNGTSDIIVQTCYNNPAYSSTSTNVKYDATSFVAMAYYYNTSSSTSPCSATTASGTQSNRPQMIFNGNYLGTGGAGYTWSWSDGTTNVGAAAASTQHSPSTAGSIVYTATATNTATTCSASGSASTVTVNALPAAPTSTTSATQCGTPVYSVPAVAGTTYKWYTASSGGTSIATGATYIYAGYTAGATNTLYVSATNTSTGCEGSRTQINVAASTPPALTISKTGTVGTCVNRIETLTVTSNTADYNSYVWSPTTNLYIDAAATTAYNGGSATTVYYKRGSTNASDAIQLTAQQSSGSFCTNTVSVAFNVQANPTITSVTATPTGAVCSGSTVALNGLAVDNGNVTIGTATTLTAATSQPTAFCNRWTSYRMQLLFTAAELQAAGLRAGNMDSIAFNISTLGDAATNSAFRVKMGTTSLSAFTAFVDTTTGFTDVYLPQTYTHTASGWQVIKFGTPYVWDGTSNIVLQVAHNGANATNNSQTYYTATTGSNKVAYSTNGSSTATLSVNRLNTKFYGQAIGASSYTWSWTNTLGATIANGATSSDVPTVSAATNVTYTARATNASTTCYSESNAAAIAVNPTAAATISISTATTTVCSGNSVVFTATTTNGSLTQTLQWKKNGTNVGAGGATMVFAPGSLATGDIITCVLTTNNSCNGGGTVTSNSITVTVNPSPALNPLTNPFGVVTNVTYCSLGNQLSYYAGIPGGTWSSSNTSVVTTTVNQGPGGELHTQNATITAIGNGTAVVSYSLADATSGCTTNSSVNVTVAVNSNSNAITGLSSVCSGNSIVLANATPSGNWSVYPTTYGSINSSGVFTAAPVTANGSAIATISYTTYNANACPAVVTKAVTVKGLPPIPSIGYAPGTANPQTASSGGMINMCLNKTFNLVGSPSPGVWSNLTPTFVSLSQINSSTATVQTIANGSNAAVKYTYTNPTTQCSNSRTMTANIVTCPSSKGTMSSIRESEIAFNMYPNPAKDVVNIKMDMLIGNADVIITDVLGKQLRQQNLSLGNNEVDITNLAKGFYLVNIRTKDGVKTQKLVVE